MVHAKALGLQLPGLYGVEDHPCDDLLRRSKVGSQGESRKRYAASRQTGPGSVGRNHRPHPERDRP